MVYLTDDVVKIPNSWNFHLVNEKGKLQINALFVLSEIYYEYEKQAEKDTLVKMNYRSLHHRIGLSKNQIRAALVFLEKKQLIKREFQNVEIESYLTSVMFLKINLERLEEITYNIQRNEI